MSDHNTSNEAKYDNSEFLKLIEGVSKTQRNQTKWANDNPEDSLASFMIEVIKSLESNVDTEQESQSNSAKENSNSKHLFSKEAEESSKND